MNLILISKPFKIYWFYIDICVALLSFSKTSSNSVLSEQPMTVLPVLSQHKKIHVSHPHLYLYQFLSTVLKSKSYFSVLVSLFLLYSAIRVQRSGFRCTMAPSFLTVYSVYFLFFQLRQLPADLVCIFALRSSQHSRINTTSTGSEKYTSVHWAL